MTMSAASRDEVRLVVRVADASERMTWPLAEPDASMAGLEPARTKAHAVDMATRDLVVTLARDPRAERVFYASVSFNDRVTQRCAPRPVTEVPRSESFDPTEPGVGSTRIWLGLEAARALVEDFRRRRGPDGPVQTVVVLRAGSACEDAGRTRTAAERLRALPDTRLAACVYAPPPNASSFLASVVSDDRLFRVVSSADELRRFLHDSVATAEADATPPAS